MPCPVCGDICRCASHENDTDKDHFVAAARWQPDADIIEVAIPPALPEPPQTGEPHQDSTAAPHLQAGTSQCADEPASSWRQEVAARLNRYQSRRKPRPPRYPSLRLRFEGENPDSANAASAETSPFPQVVLSNRALALDEFSPNASFPVSDTQSVQDSSTFPSAEAVDSAAITVPVPAPITAKIIEFPRSWTPPPVPLDELAEPVLTRPRILEAPEIVPPP